MLTVVGITLPIFLLIGLGYLVARLKVLTPEQVRGLGAFVLTLALPALVFQSLASRSLNEIAHPEYLTVYAIGSLTAFSIGFAWFRLARHTPTSISAVRALGMSFSNTGFIGLPVVLQFLGTAATVPVALTMIVENLLLLPLALTIAQLGSSQQTSLGQALRSIAIDLARTPLLIAIAAGALFSIFGISLPEIVARGVGLLAASSAPVALIAIGGGLVGISLKGKATALATIAAGKLLLHPLIVLALLVLIPVPDPTLRSAALILAAMPMLSLFPILAVRYGDQETSGAALLATTALSFFTISALLSFLAP